MNAKKRSREFLIAPEADVVRDVLRDVGDAASVAAVVSVLKKSPYAWDMTPVLLKNCGVPGYGYHPTLRSVAERSAITDAYLSLSDENQWILCNYASAEGVTAEMETDARQTLIFSACSAICQLYGDGAGFKFIRSVAQNTLYNKYPNLRRTYDPEDLLQVALERLHVNFYRIHPQSYRGYLIRAIQTHARDRSRIEAASPIIEATDPDDENIGRPVAPVAPPHRPPHSKVLIEEALDELRAALRQYFSELGTVRSRSRYQKVAMLLIYELGDDADVSQAELARLLGCSPQSITDWRADYLAALPSIFKVLTEVW